MDFNVRENCLMVTNTPLPGYSLPNLLRILAQNHFHVSPRYVPRFTYCIALSSIMAPFYVRERMKYDKTVKDTKISKDPIFIIGHWRCGTTLLHNILSCDQQFGYFSTFQAYLPTVYLSGEKLFKPLVVSSLPKKRPMDDGDLDADLPQEDQYAMGAVSPYSYYHGWCFPQNMNQYNGYVCMANASSQTIDDWKRIYLDLLKKITLYHQGRQLVLKNQDNTGKIPQLLELFPDARFIYLYRNPYDLYMSMRKFMRIVIPRYCVQTPPPFDAVEDRMMALFAEMTKKYLKDKALIPADHLAEVRYESFVKQPPRTVHGLYKKFGLAGYDAAEPAFKAYLVTQKTIHTDHYRFTEPDLRKIENHWGFALREYGYQRPSEQTA